MEPGKIPSTFTSLVKYTPLESRSQVFLYQRTYISLKKLSRPKTQEIMCLTSCGLQRKSCGKCVLIVLVFKPLGLCDFVKNTSLTLSHCTACKKTTYFAFDLFEGLWSRRSGFLKLNQVKAPFVLNGFGYFAY